MEPSPSLHTLEQGLRIQLKFLFQLKLEARYGTIIMLKYFRFTNTTEIPVPTWIEIESEVSIGPSNY